MSNASLSALFQNPLISYNAIPLSHSHLNNVLSGTFTPAIWSTFAWTEMFNNGLCIHFPRLRGATKSHNSSRLINRRCEWAIRVRSHRRESKSKSDNRFQMDSQRIKFNVCIEKQIRSKKKSLSCPLLGKDNVIASVAPPPTNSKDTHVVFPMLNWLVAPLSSGLQKICV